MCFSEASSFGMGGLLIAGGGLCLYKSWKTNKRYLPMAIFPFCVGIQQTIEGLVWLGAENNNATMMYDASLGYMFFVWIFWPLWVPLMTYTLEPNENKRRLFIGFAVAGVLWGTILYIPYFWHQGWLNAHIVEHSISYSCKFVPDVILPRQVIYFIYLAIIGLPPLLSSHWHMKIFGLMLVISVLLTNLFFVYATTSVLCFFGAFITLYILYIILYDKCSKSPVFD
jgi:hypothetical protein